jgi:hypothetical protein
VSKLALQADASRSVRRDLRALLALECVHTLLAIALLSGVAMRSVLMTDEPVVALTIVGVVTLAAVFLVLAVRLRSGQEGLRRELIALELHREAALVPRRHPYR